MGFIARLFYRIGFTAAKHPVLTIVIASLLVALGCVGFYTLKVTVLPT